MIYLDNAATTMMKPPAVAEAVACALTSFGGVGRGVHPASFAAGMAVYDARVRVAELLGAPSASRVSFALNVTMALNIALDGLLSAGEGAVTTAASHNSVLRPMFRARDERGCWVDVVRIAPDGSLDWGSYERALERGPRVVAVTHASNLTGDVYDVARMACLAHDAGAVFVLDAAQTAGALPVDMGALDVDVLCFTGHKSLFGPQGTGGLCLAGGIVLPPLLEGGSGVRSYDERHPRFMPEALEAGTVNAHGLAGLAAGVEFLQNVGVDTVHAHVAHLADAFEVGARAVPGVRVAGGHGGVDRSGIVALNVGDVDSALVADRLTQEFDICVRAGAHCAPLMHRALGTKEQGAVRFSFSWFNTMEEAEAAVDALSHVACELEGAGV